MAITEITTTFRFEYNTIKCDRRDLKYILELIKKEENLEFYAFNVEGYMLETIEDLDKLNIPTSSFFHVTVYKNIKDTVMTIHFTENDKYIEIANKNDSSIYGLAVKLNDYIKDKKKSNFYSVPFFIWFIIVLTSIIFKPDINTIGFIIASSILIIGYYLTNISKRKSPLIYIKEELDRRSLFKRKKDDIYINVIFMVAGAILGYLLSELRLLKDLFK